MTKVFVYGTLKRGYGNNKATGLDTQVFISEAVTCGSYLLTGVGFPYLCEKLSDGENYFPVKGEVWEVSDPDVMRRLDILEGVEYGHYQHHQTKVVSDNGDIHEVLSYMSGYDDARTQPKCPAIDGVYVWSR